MNEISVKDSLNNARVEGKDQCMYKFNHVNKIK